MGLMQSYVGVLASIHYHFMFIADSIGLEMRQDVRASFRGLLQSIKECYAVMRIDPTREDLPAVIDEHEIDSWRLRLSSLLDVVESPGYVLWEGALVKALEGY